MKRAAGWLFVLVGAGLLVSAGLNLRAETAFLDRAERADGVVTRLNAGPVHPQVRFTTQNGALVECAQGGWITPVAVGERVAVLYDPVSPRQTARFDILGARHGTSMATAVLGALFLLVGGAAAANASWLHLRGMPAARGRVAT